MIPNYFKTQENFTRSDIIIIITPLRVFHISASWFFYWSLSDSKSPQVFRTLRSILADLNNDVLWMVSTRPLISKSSCPFINLFVLLSFSGSIFFLQFSGIVRPSFFSFSFSFTLNSNGMVKSTIRHVLFFLITITRSGRLDEIRWSICISKS